MIVVRVGVDSSVRWSKSRYRPIVRTLTLVLAKNFGQTDFRTIEPSDCRADTAVRGWLLGSTPFRLIPLPPSLLILPSLLVNFHNNTFESINVEIILLNKSALNHAN